MRRTRSLKRTLLAVLLVMVVSSPLAACGELAPYPVKDSGIYAEEPDLVWLDNQRVLFHGHKGMESSSGPNKILRLVDRGLLGDTTTGALELYNTFDKRSDGLLLQSSLCVHDGVLTYVNRGMVITGKRGQEIKTPFPKPAHWFNPHSCRYYDTKPFWVVEGHQTIPLLEEHGYLDLGVRPEPDYLTLRIENSNPAISFYSVPAKKSVTLPIGWQEVGFLQVHYAPFRDAYLLSGFQDYDEQRGFLPAWPDDVPIKVWWLKPDGTVIKQEVPKLPWSHGNAFRFFPARKGLYLSKQSPSGPEAFEAMGDTLFKAKK